MAGQVAKGGQSLGQKDLLKEVPQDLEEEEAPRTRRITRRVSSMKMTS
jgi:hypothetical protein